MKLHISRHQVAGEYNFAADPTGGAVGIIALDVQLPVLAKVVGFRICTLTAFTDGGGGATLSFGLRQLGVTTPITNPTALTPPTGLSVYNAVDGSGKFQPFGFTDFAVNPVKVYTDYEVIFAISNAPLTGGRAEFEVEYTLMNE